MSLPASDSLSSGTTQTIQAYSANWTAIVGTIDVSNNGNGAFPNTPAANSTAIWNADAFPADQYCQCVIGLVGSAGQFIGPAVRASNTGTITEYALRVNPAGSQWQVIKFVSNSFTNMSGTQSGTFIAGDTLKIQAVGQSPSILVQAFQNGNLLYSVSNETSIASGSAGLAGFGQGTASTGPEVKNWQAGAIVTPQLGQCVYILP